MKLHPLILLAVAFAYSFNPATAEESPATPEASGGEKLKVAVAIPPYEFLVSSIGGEHVKITTLIDAGQDPHQFNLTPGQTIELSACNVFFTSGLPFEEQFIFEISAETPDLKMVYINRGLELIESSHAHHHHDHGDEHEAHGESEGEEEDGHDHDHHHHHHHDHSGPDPHTWTSPAYLGMQAITVQETLTKFAPEHADAFKANLEAFLKKLSEADKEISENLKPHKGKAFFVFHPAFGYFAMQYGLTEKAIEVEGKQPTAKQLLEIIEEAGAAKTKAIFIEPQFNTSTAKEVASKIGAKVVVVDPLQEDILGTLVEFSKALNESLSE